MDHSPLRLAFAGVRPWIVGLLALSSSAALVAHFHDRSWYPPDDGNYAHVAERILEGEVLNREVQDIHAGYINFTNATAMALFGRRMVSLRYPLAFITLLQSGAIFLLFRRRGPWLAALAAVTAAGLGFPLFPNPTAHWYSLALTYLVATVLHTVPPEARWRLPAVGFLVAAVVGFRQLTGVLVAMGALAYLLMEASALQGAGVAGAEGQGDESGEGPPEPGRGRRSRWPARALAAIMAAGLVAYLGGATGLVGWLFFGLWPVALLAASMVWVRLGARELGRLIGGLAAGAVPAVLPLLGYHALHGSLGSWWNDVVVTAMALPRLGFVRALDLFSAYVVPGLSIAVQAPSLAEKLNGLFWAVAPCVGPALGITVLLLHLRWRGRPRAGALPVLAVFYGVISVHLQNLTYLFFTLGFSLLAVLWLAAGAGRRTRFAATAAVVVLAAVAVGFHAGQSINRGWKGAMLGHRIPLGEAPELDRCGLEIDARDRAVYTRLVRLIQWQTSAGEAIFALPTNAELYFLAERRNPFRFFNTALGLRSMEGAREALASLAAAPPRLVVYAPEDKYNTPESRWLMAELEGRYELLARVDRFEVHRLRGGAAPAGPGGGSP